MMQPRQFRPLMIAALLALVSLLGQVSHIAFQADAAPPLFVNESWSQLPYGVGIQELGGAHVRALALNADDVYAGGIFTDVCGNWSCTSGNTKANNIARWSASHWSSMPDFVSVVNALAMNGNTLYAGAEYAAPAFGVGKWDGTSWSRLGYGLNGTVNALAVSGSDVYVGGPFTQVCQDFGCFGSGTQVSHVAKWSETTSSWSPLGNGVDGSVNAIAINGADVYLGGEFTHVCGNPACSVKYYVGHIVRWNSGAWYDLGYGFDGNVQAIVAYGSAVYAGGLFTQVCGEPGGCENGNTTVNHIAKWDGSSWSALDNGVNENVYALAVKGDYLYVGGGFTELCSSPTCDSGTATMNRIAKWWLTASSWAYVDYGVNATVLALAVRADEIYVGGMFSAICGDALCTPNGSVGANYVAKYGPPPTPTSTPTTTQIRTATATPSATGAPTETSTRTPTLTGTATETSIKTPTGTPTKIQTGTPTRTPTTPLCSSRPATPNLTAPGNDTVAGPRVTLKWTNVTCETKYQVLVKEAASGDKAFGKKLDTDVTRVKTKALPAGDYKWFVKACNEAGCNKSSTRSFTVQ